MNDLINKLIEDISQQNSVESVLLAGSRSINNKDKDSDYDLYIYNTEPLLPNIRSTILEPICQKTEINNSFWETEDNIVLKDGTYCDLIYRDPKWLSNKLERVVINHIASVGYTTCLWYNLLNSKMIYDPKDTMKRMQSRFNVEYASMLKYNIIDKNMPLIGDSIPSYIYQIEKAIQREDKISINHRISEYLVSYFDIIFAVNLQPHPGEKRLLSLSKKLCKKLPEDFEENLNKLLNYDNLILIEVLWDMTEKLMLIL